MPSLHADVYLTPAYPVHVPLPLPNGHSPLFTESTSTLIHSANEAIIVDPLLSPEQASSLADWITATVPNKTLTTIYITHGHGDHWFGMGPLKQRFPSAKIVATKGTLEHMYEQIDPNPPAGSAGGAPFWQNAFPDLTLPSKESLADVHVLEGPELTIDLEGHTLHAVPVGHSDTDDSTVLWVPELKLVVAGDAVYNGPFQYMAETTTPEKRQEWIDAVKKVKALEPVAVVTGHKRPGAVDGAWVLAWTIEYLEAWGQAVKEVQESGGGAKEMFWKMSELFPDNNGEMILWLSCLTQFGPPPS